MRTKLSLLIIVVTVLFIFLTAQPAKAHKVPISYSTYSIPVDVLARHQMERLQVVDPPPPPTPPPTTVAPITHTIVRPVTPIKPVIHVPTPTVSYVHAAAVSSGAGCYGITDPDALWIIARESHCSVYAYNPSGACGIGQLKSGCYGYNGYAQAAAMVSYVNGRYGSFAAAKAFWESHGWY